MKNVKRGKVGRASGGFSILEALVAIAILIIALTGPMVFAQQSLRAARLARDQVTAFYLAQDAIEFVKHVRDENSLSTLFRDDWLAGLEECFADEGNPNSGCQVSTPEWTGGSTDSAVDACPGSDCPLYEQEPLAGGKLYGIFGGGASVESRFSRRVRIMTPEGDNPSGETEEALVEVRVWWDTTGVSGERQVLVREHVYNWIQ